MAESKEQRMAKVSAAVETAICAPGHEMLARALMRWIESHPGDIDPREVAKDFEADAFELADLLHLLVQSGQFRRVYRIVAPDGTLTDHEFEDFRQIPEKILHDYRFFDTAKANVIPFLKPA